MINDIAIAIVTTSGIIGLLLTVMAATLTLTLVSLVATRKIED